jgi:hypothetical protein
MTPLGIDWIATAALAVWLGWAGPRSLKPAIALCAGVGLVGWAASYLIMLLSPTFGGDISAAEAYINGFNARNAAAEISVVLAWTLVWFGIVRVVLTVLRRGSKRAT